MCALVRQSSGVLIVCAVLLSLAGCTPESPNPEQFVGYWYSEYVSPHSGVQVRSIAERRPDGVIAIQFRQYRDGTFLKEHREAGRWFVADGLYKVHTKIVDGLLVDPQQPENYDTYTIVSLSNDEIIYKHDLAGITFHGKRVDSTFKLP